MLSIYCHDEYIYCNILYKMFDDQLVIQKEGEFVRLNNSVIAFLNRKAGPNFMPRIRVM